MKPFLKVIAYLSIIPLLIGLFFFSNIKGYYRFKHYCEAEGGLRVYEKLERNVGWWAKDKYEARVAALLDGVGFVRYTDKKDGQIYDLKYIGGDPQDDSSFERIIANESQSVAYEWRYSDIYVPKELRLGKGSYEILDIKSEHIFVGFYWFGYKTTDPRNTPFGPATSETCFDDIDSTGHRVWKKQINSAFKN